MAARFAGDYFGVSLASPETRSSLVEYFPSLRTAGVKKKQEGVQPSGSRRPRTTGGYEAPGQFGGFKPVTTRTASATRQ